ncbi:MAG: hypothetical protein RL698_243 [Pseudomonadota bacterium]|jgi:hypothetical protein
MRIPKEQIPVKLDVPGAKARQLSDFGVASGTIGAEYFSLGAGTDIAPLLQGLDGDSCHAPHWGYVISGDLVVSYRDGSSDRCVGGDVFYWPPGHTVRVTQDAEIILFSPQKEHLAVMDHMARKLGVV